MECPVCGYDYMDVEVDDGRVIYTCPECEKESGDKCDIEVVKNILEIVKKINRRIKEV